MKIYASFCIALLTVVIIACDQQKNYVPDLYLSKEKQALLIEQSVRYSAKLPPTASHENKFGSEYDSYYNLAVGETDLRRCFPAGEKQYYFLMTRKARSIWPAREAIGGKVTVDENDKLQNYEEVFRTWKMTEDTLNTRSFELFDLMVKGKDLTPYRAKYKGDKYIEFPDDYTYYDKNDRIWRRK